MTDNLPDFLRNRRSRLLNDVTAGLGTTSQPPHISIMGNRFTLVDAMGMKEPVQTLYLDVCIIDVLEHKAKQFYREKFAEGSSSPPVCWSTNGIGPSVNAAEPQSQLCSNCDNNVWGSAVGNSGNKIKACRDFIHLACMVPGNDFAFLMRLPPNSHKNLQGYIEKFKGTGVDLSDAVTRLSFMAGVQGTIEFKGAALIDEAMFKTRETILVKKGTDSLLGRDDRPVGSVAAPKPALGPGAPAPAPALGPGAKPPPPALGPDPEPPPAPSPPAPPQEEVRRRRKSATQEAPAIVAQQPAQPVQAPFRPTTPPVPPAGNGPLFGVSKGVEPPPDIKSTLDNLFK